MEIRTSGIISCAADEVYVVTGAGLGTLRGEEIGSIAFKVAEFMYKIVQ
jgi:hypothetical protein